MKKTVYYTTRPNARGDVTEYGEAEWLVVTTLMAAWVAALLWSLIAEAYAVYFIITAVF